LEKLDRKVGSPIVPFRTKTQAAAAAHESWAATPDRSARTLAAREAYLAKLEAQVDPDGVMSDADRRKAAANKRKANLLWAA
jgi:hypothetical protein